MSMTEKMSPDMLAKLAAERAAIKAIRDIFPATAQKRLARQIRDKAFPYSQDLIAGHLQQVGYRTLYSIYSVIRRHDAKRAELVTA